jgi:hypothetical protein
MNRILLLGGSGILGPEVFHIIDLEGYDYVAPTSTDLDIRDRESNFSSSFQNSNLHE